MMAAILEAADWNLEDAVTAWGLQRASLIAQRQAQGDAQAPSQQIDTSSPSYDSSPSASSSSASSCRPVTAASSIPSPTSTAGKIIIRLRLPQASSSSSPQPPSPSPSSPPPQQQSRTQTIKASDNGESTKGGSETSPEVEIPFNDSFEQERRDAVLALRLHLEERLGNTGTISPAEATLLLHQQHWDLTQAARSFGTLERTRRGLACTYDQMRSVLQGPVAEVNQPTTLMQQNERLAELINITGRNDWYSLRVCLQQHSWDLVATVSQWFSEGIPPEEAQASVAPHGGVRMDVNLRPLPMPTRDSARSASSRKGWALEPEAFATEGGEDGQSSSEEEESTLLKQERKRPHGFMVNSTRSTAKKGMRNDRLFLIEYISRGRYWYNRFERQQTFKWPGVGFTAEALGQDHHHHPQADDKHLVEFDWSNQQHLTWLNNWRRQNIQRATGLQIRARAQRWSPEELQFLYDLSEELLQEKARRFPRKTVGQLLPLMISKATKEDWAKRMNEKFSGTIQPGSDRPRFDREETALMTQRARTRAIVDRFQLRADEDFFAKAARKQERAVAARGVKRPRQEDDSSEEGVLETDSEHEGGGCDDEKHARNGDDGEGDTSV